MMAHQELVTPITPAAVLGHVNAAPRPTTVRGCGWLPSDIAHVLFGRVGVTPRLRDNLDWVRRIRAALHPFAPVGPENEPVAVLLRAAEQLAEDAILRELEIIEAAGDLAVSVSAYDADSDCAVVYYCGKPIGSL